MELKSDLLQRMNDLKLKMDATKRGILHEQGLYKANADT